MNSKTGLHSASNTLLRSTKVTKLVTALAKIENGVALTNDDREALRQGVEFLEKVKMGYESADSPTINDESRLHAEYFRAAVESWRQIGLSPKFLDDIEEMQELLQYLGEGNDHIEEVSKVKSFFRQILEQDINSLKERENSTVINGLDII